MTRGCLSATLRLMDSGGSESKRTVGSERLSAHIQRKGLRLEDFAAKVGTDKALVSKWINGLRRPGVAYVLKIERTTGIPASAWLRLVR